MINVVTRQGSDRFLSDASYYGQAAALTSQPVQLVYPGPGQPTSGYERVRYRDVDDESRRSGRARSPVVLYRIPASARLRQSAGYRPRVPQNLRTGQDLCEAHLAHRSGPATAAKLPRRVLGESRAADACQAVRSDAAPARVGSGHDVRPPDAHVVLQHGVGCARRPLRLHSRRRPEHRQRDDAEPVRSRDGRLQRRAADVWRTHAHSHDDQGHDQSLPAGAAGRRSPMEDRRSVRKGRAHPVDDHSDRRPIRRQRGTAVSIDLEFSVSDRWCLLHRFGVRQRCDHAGKSADHQCRAAVRPQPCHQSGPARARCAGTRNRDHRRRSGDAVYLERLVAASGHHDETHLRRANDASRELWEVQPGRPHRRAFPIPPWCDADHDSRCQRGDRGLHDHRLRRRSQEEPAARSRDALTSHGRILDWRGPRGRAATGGGDRLRSQERQSLHRMDGCRWAVPGGDCGRCRTGAACRCS